MGYTHYFTQTQDCPPDQWEALCKAAREAIAQRADLVCREYDAPDQPPVIDDTAIMFNGKGDDGHETFVLHRLKSTREPRYAGDEVGFQFCKTAEKPYDFLVVAVLCLAHKLCPGVWEISSDGGAEDWLRGKALAETVVGEITMQIED